MSAEKTVLDWTTGNAGIAFQRCRDCKGQWYFHRDFCPRCGRSGPKSVQASGRGVVHALTRVHRAPTEALRAHAPYTIVLVDAEEGFRLMAHGAPELAIGDAVQARFVPLDDSLIPYFERT